MLLLAGVVGALGLEGLPFAALAGAAGMEPIHGAPLPPVPEEPGKAIDPTSCEPTRPLQMVRMTSTYLYTTCVNEIHWALVKTTW